MKTSSRTAIFASTIIAGMLITKEAVIPRQTNATQQSTAATQVIKATPFQVKISQEKLDYISRRVREYRWYEPIKGNDGRSVGWRYGTDITYMKELADYWLKKYDWRKTEASINRFKNYRAKIDGLNLHFIVEKGSGSNPQPLLIIHGWPYSFLSYLDVIKRLAHPERYGGNAEDGFDVIVVSVPGYGFSDAPTQPVGLRAFGRLYHKLMTQVLGYKQYIVHGGDQGAISATFMTLEFPQAVKGLHTNMLFPRHPEAPFGSGQAGPAPVTEAERQFARAEAEMFNREMAYIQTHITRPETLSVAMMDSPVGVASWTIEKYHSWADKQSRRFEDIFTREQLLNEVMLYLVTDTFRTSLWTYAAFVHEPPVLPSGRKITVPTAVTQWQDPIHPLRPREFVERSIANITQWTVMPQGGHFPFYEERDRYVADLIEFGRKLR